MDGQTDKVATVCSPFGEHNKRAMMALDHSPELRLAMKVMASME